MSTTERRAVARPGIPPSPERDGPQPEGMMELEKIRSNGALDSAVQRQIAADAIAEYEGSL